MPPIVSEEHKENRRKKILESALVCFAEYGFEAATMDDIVTRSGISKGSIYNYFKTKDDLYIQLMNDYTQSNFEFIKRKFKGLASAADKVHCLFDLYKHSGGTSESKNLILVHGEFFLSSSRKKDIRSLVLKRYKEVYRQFIIEIIEEGKNAGEFIQSADPAVIAAFFWTMVDGICLDYAVIGKDYPFQSIFEKAEEVFLAMLQPIS